MNRCFIIISSNQGFIPTLLLPFPFGLLKMGGGTCFGMPTPELEAVSAPSWGTGLRPLLTLLPFFLNQRSIAEAWRIRLSTSNIQYFGATAIFLPSYDNLLISRYQLDRPS